MWNLKVEGSQPQGGLGSPCKYGELVSEIGKNCYFCEVTTMNLRSKSALKQHQRRKKKLIKGFRTTCSEHGRHFKGIVSHRKQNIQKVVKLYSAAVCMRAADKTLQRQKDTNKLFPSPDRRWKQLVWMEVIKACWERLKCQLKDIQGKVLTTLRTGVLLCNSSLFYFTPKPKHHCFDNTS